MITKISDHILLDTTNNCFAVSLLKDKQDLLNKIKIPYELKQQNKVVGYFPNSVESCRLIYNLGETDIIKALPIYYDSNFLVEGQYKPMEHQRLTAAFMCVFNRCYILSDCRLGKTGSAIMAMDWLQNVGMIKNAALIVTTLTTVTSVWLPNLQSSCPNKAIINIHGKKDLAYLKEPYHFYVTNYDSIRTNYDEFHYAITSGRINYILIDELTHCGNVKAQRTKALAKLINSTGIAYAAGMTGTPGSNPEPVFGMCKTINPKNFRFYTKGSWLDATTKQVGLYPNQRINRPEAPQLIFDAMQPAIRFKKEEVLDLPPIVEQIRLSDLTSKQKQIIEKMWEEALVTFNSGEQISAVNAAVKLNKILQIAQGFAFDADGKIISLIPDNFTDPRSRTILEAVQETERKVVIFSMFRQRLKLLQKMLLSNQISASVIHGDVKSEERGKILNDFKNKADPHVLIAHPTTVGYGTELSVADTLIIDGPLLLGGFSYSQTLERLSSIKQQAAKISIIKVAGDSREVKLFKRMDKEQKMSAVVAGLFEEARRDQYGEITKAYS